MNASTRRARPTAGGLLLAVMLTALIGPLLPGTAVADPDPAADDAAGGPGEHRARRVRPAAARPDERGQGDGRRTGPDVRSRVAHARAGLVELPGGRRDRRCAAAQSERPGPTADQRSRRATAWAENVASWSPGTTRTAASVFGLYMNSPGHQGGHPESDHAVRRHRDRDQRRECRLQHAELHRLRAMSAAATTSTGAARRKAPGWPHYPIRRSGASHPTRSWHSDPDSERPARICRRTGWSTGAASTRSRRAGDAAC